MAASSAERIATQSAPERVAGVLRDELLDGAHPVGSRFREEDLAKRFDVGRHTVRSALRLLVERGLVVHERNRGAVVAPLSRRRIDEVFDYRKVLELGALDMALARNADFGQALREVRRLEALARRTHGPSWRELTGVHSAIHRAIVAAAGNQHLLDSYQRCEDEVRLLLTFIRPDFDAARLAVVHRELIDKLALGGQVATEALIADIDGAGRAALLTALRRAEESARLIGR
ncbi:GntR family transcriptional regulator [Amycolatopsis endophytica]|uniref:DNA-binding GntR family transcriptional regulator n=1 Tax=Amycolatopsis endophytica TaxID=860233 RepID=A0A853B597_9PSEU|nr:GntR family transcriptional regulator [Amycolatopsis endophytica]NYI89911.1 DNA-binding GntR family transcriptional regulator [Amycolatopsis endophytica]